ncbi:MAG: SDR family NAD(P)-dependent oxidoreductase, partial [Deltaproteobacteria bacterium]|nr:SDR family NAD(P)-dependent oxidoreductase [Deltaproteobacteria bacterium]
MSDPLDYSGKAVIVTGGGRGVGRGISERFLAAGADVVICGRNQPDALPEKNGRQALYCAADVRDIEQIERVVDFTMDHFARLDVLINNAGGAPEADAATASPRFSEAIIRL